MTVEPRSTPPERVPVICAEFAYAGSDFQVIAWPETDEDAFEWDVVRSDVPYVWRSRQTFSEDFV